MGEEIRIEEFAKLVTCYLVHEAPRETTVKQIQHITEELCCTLSSYCEKHNIKNDVYSTED